MQKISNVFKLTTEEKVKLKYGLNEACQDPLFLEMVRELDIEEDILMKYTSILKDAAKEKRNCKECKGYAFCNNQVKGYCFTPEKNENQISFSYFACPYKKEEGYKKNVQLFDVSKRIQSASMAKIFTNDKNRIEIIKYLKKYITAYFQEKPIKPIYLHGSFGCGKTYLIAALFNEFAKKEVKSIIIHVPELMRSMKESFDTDYKERFHELKTVPLLLLDDIGAEYLTAWGRDEVLEPLLQYRMDEELPTFFTSNFTLDQLETHFAVSSSGIEKVKAKRIIERMKELSVPMELISKNMRY